MPSTCENVSSITPGPRADLQLNRSTFLECLSASKKAVIGLYGVPGSGKTFLLGQLKKNLSQEHFAFYEGSEVIDIVTPGGLDVFRKMQGPEQMLLRQRAIETIRKECTESGKVAIVTGHFMFWHVENEEGSIACTQSDLDSFTHILYLDVPAKLIVQRQLTDGERSRPPTDEVHLCKWQQAESTELRSLCRKHGILFLPIPPRSTLLNDVILRICDFCIHSEEHNLSCAEKRLDDVLATSEGQLETMVVMDADRTLAAEDSGALFWEKARSSRLQTEEGCPLKKLFSSPLGYSYAAFRQATLLYEEADDEEFETICQQVASGINIYPEFVSLLKQVAKKTHIGAVVITCGPKRIWQNVLDRHGLSETVKVIGGGRIADGFVVTSEVKAALVARLQSTHQVYVWAFGDSPLDVKMMSKAHQAIVVVGDEQTRSKSMESVLKHVINNDGFRARQTLLPSHASIRLDTNKLPVIKLKDPKFVDSVLRSRIPYPGIRVIDATTKSAAKLLMRPTRDARIAGPALRKAHCLIGWYLATEYLGDIIGLEEYPIPHVQDYETSGHRLLNEKKTTIVPLMRGGEAMAFGVNDVYPLAMFVHANGPKDIRPHHLDGQHTVVLVDSVVNSGYTIARFVEHIRSLDEKIHIVVIAGVVSAESVTVGSSLFEQRARVMSMQYSMRCC